MNTEGMCIFALSLTLGITGCMSHQKPNVVVYPEHDQPAVQVARDKMDCRAWAEEETGYSPHHDTLEGAGTGAVIGALGGAAAGAIIGAAAGDPGTGAAVGAAVGGVGGAGIGGTQGYRNNRDSYNQAYAVCMEARNYHVR